MKNLEEAKVLLAAASRDINALLGMLQVKEFFSDEIFGLHVQQAVEKTSKAWLVILKEIYPFTHDLDRLFQQLENAGGDVSNYRSLIRFTPFSSQLRYEALLGGSDPIEREAVLEQVQEFYAGVEFLLYPPSEDNSDEDSEKDT